jgi:tetratricopeptide (TPR) repeat protein
MVKGRSALTLFAVVLFGASFAYAQQAAQSERLFSPLTADTFHNMARRLYTSNPGDEKSAQTAMVFLNAAMELNPRGEDPFEDVLILGSQSDSDENFDLVLKSLRKYVTETSDFEVLRKAVRYMISTADSRQEREQLLMRLFLIVRRDNALLASELASELAQLAAEKGDDETAKNYYAEAYGYNKYNALAFERYNELLRKDNQGLAAYAYARDLRLAMDINPLDIDRVFVFADYCERIGAYDVSAEAYEYAANLFEYLSPGEELPAAIYLPWLMTNYNTPEPASKCLSIANRLRRSGRFDIRVEALAALAARKSGDVELSKEMLSAAGQKAEDMLRSRTTARGVTEVELGWFYAFAQPTADQALAWANRAFTADPDMPGAKSVFGYALAMNEQFELAESYAVEAQGDQIATLTLAMVQLSKNQKDTAIENLKSAVAMDPLSLAAEKARGLLVANGSEYISPTGGDAAKDELKKEFGERIVPLFRPAKDILSAKLNLGGSEFSYGSDINAQLVVTNNSAGTIVVSDEGIFTGNIRVDAEVTGDISRKFPMLISKKVTPSQPVEPGDYLSIGLDLKTGPLGRLLAAFPQATVEIQFTAYLDPTVDADGSLRNSLGDIEPITNTVKRRRVELTRQYLTQRLDALAGGQEGQKIRACRLFLGLLIEQDFMSESRPLYRYTRVERPILIDAVKRSLADDNWKVRLHAIEALTQFAGKLDSEVTNALAVTINDTHWPVRMAAMYLLSKSQTEGFGRVLEWSAKSDSEPIVRSMAGVLGDVDASKNN